MSKRKRLVSTFDKYLKIPILDKKHSTMIFRKRFFLSENNRSTRIFKQIETGKITEIICVSLEIIINNKWETIVYYDNVHGYLHRHERLSASDESETIATLGVRQKGTVRRLLKWAIRDISINYINYKKRFLKSSGFSKTEIWENMY